MYSRNLDITLSETETGKIVKCFEKFNLTDINWKKGTFTGAEDCA